MPHLNPNSITKNDQQISASSTKLFFAKLHLDCWVFLPVRVSVWCYRTLHFYGTSFKTDSSNIVISLEKLIGVIFERFLLLSLISDWSDWFLFLFIFHQKSQIPKQRERIKWILRRWWWSPNVTHKHRDEKQNESIYNNRFICYQWADRRRRREWNTHKCLSNDGDRIARIKSKIEKKKFWSAKYS